MVKGRDFRSDSIGKAGLPAATVAFCRGSSAVSPLPFAASKDVTAWIPGPPVAAEPRRGSSPYIPAVGWPSSSSWSGPPDPGDGPEVLPKARWAREWNGGGSERCRGAELVLDEAVGEGQSGP